MKKLCAIVFAAALFCGCTADLKDRVDALEQRVQALETKVNSNAEGISALVDAAQKAVTITKVEKNDDSYTIYFSDNTTATITNGKNGTDGKDGKDGVTPVIGVAEVDGVLYWTVDGEFLLNNGEKLPVSGKDGAVPQFKIENGVWYVSVDGTTWDAVPVSGTEAPQLVMEETDTEYIFTLGETVIKIGKENAFAVKVDTTNVGTNVGEGLIVLHYTLTGGDDSTVVLAESEELGVKVDAENNCLNITVPETVMEGHILLRAIRNSDSKYAAQYITVKVDRYGIHGGAITVSADEYVDW